MGPDLGDGFPVALPEGAAVVLYQERAGEPMLLEARLDPPNMGALVAFFDEEAEAWPGPVQREVDEDRTRWTSAAGFEVEVDDDGALIRITVTEEEGVVVDADVLVPDAHLVGFPDGGQLGFLVQSGSVEHGIVTIEVQVAYPKERRAEIVAFYDAFFGDLGADISKDDRSETYVTDEIWVQISERSTNVDQVIAATIVTYSDFG